MVYLNPSKLNIKYIDSEEIEILSRKYTLTHSDFTGELFLSIGKEYDYKKLRGLYTRFMRDEVLAEWKKIDSNYELHIYLHVSGGITFGGARFRDRILRNHLPLVIEILRYAEKDLIKKHDFLQEAEIYIHFKSNKKRYNKIENKGKID